MRHFIVFRNCFTGDKSGGDVHTGGFCKWIDSSTQDKVLLVHPVNDGQDDAYPEVKSLTNLTYESRSISNPAILMIKRAFDASFKLKIPDHDDVRFFVAGSHFIGDVLPVMKHARKTDKKIVFIHHIIQDMPRNSSLRNTLAGIQEKFCLYVIKKKFDTIITVNSLVTDRLRELGFKQKIITSSNFVENAGQLPISYAKKSTDIIFCGRIMQQKGVYDFIDIISKLHGSGVIKQAIMIGSGPESKAIEARIRKDNLPINFAGNVDEATKFKMIASAKVFLFPSIEEGWGIVIAEALSVGTPVVAYDLPVYREVFGDSIQVAPIGDHQSLEALVKDKFEKHASEKYEETQHEIVEYAQRYTLNSVIEHEYKEIVEKR